MNININTSETQKVKYHIGFFYKKTKKWIKTFFPSNDGKLRFVASKILKCFEVYLYHTSHRLIRITPAEFEPTATWFVNIRLSI